MIPRSFSMETRSRRGMHRALFAGLLDSALASLANFGIGLFAIRMLEPAMLGTYALAFSAFNLLAVVPSQLVLTPLEIRMLRVPRAERLGGLRTSLRVGIPISVVAAGLSMLWPLVAPRDVDGHAMLALTVTAAACVVLSPIQDHLRRTFHLSGESWKAAMVSAVQLTGVIGAVGVALSMTPRLPSVWVPFGALATANVLSLLVGLWAARGHVQRTAPLDVRDALGSGRWLLVIGLITPATAFAAAAMTAALAGSEALGFAEAARVIAQPVFVLAMGLSAVLGPRSTEAARKHHRRHAGRLRRTFVRVILAAGLLYGAWVAAHWLLNPFAWLVPTAYVIPGVALLAVLARVADVSVFPLRSELLGLDREREVVRADIWSNLLWLLVAATASLTHAYAMPLGALVSGLGRWPGYRSALARAYRSPRPAPVAHPEAIAI